MGCTSKAQQSFLKAIQGRDLSCFINVRLTLDLLSRHDKHWDATLPWRGGCSPSELGFLEMRTLNSPTNGGKWTQNTMGVSWGLVIKKGDATWCYMEIYVHLMEHSAFVDKQQSVFIRMFHCSACARRVRTWITSCTSSSQNLSMHIQRRDLEREHVEPEP